jgi:hypothetical protein
MPEPGGMSLDEGVAIVEQVSRRAPIVGIGLTGLVSSQDNVPRLVRVCQAAALAG